LRKFIVLLEKQVEKERAAMAMRCARAEAQLKQFQSYMKKQLAVHRKEVRKYKKEAAHWKEKARGLDII
jgi:nicotinamide riboside kinase